MSNRRKKRIAASGTVIRDEPRAFKFIASGAALSIKASEGDGDKRKLGTFEGIAYTGAPMRPEGWPNPIICDLAGFEMVSEQRPALRQHDPEQVVGHTNAIKSDSGGVKIAGLFSGEDHHVNKVVVPARNGFLWELSIGAEPVETSWLDYGEEAVVNGRTVTGPMTIAHRTRLGEVSFVPLGADDATSVSVAASQSRGVPVNPKTMLKAAKQYGNIKAAKYSDDEVEKMTEEEAKAALQKCMAEGDDGDDEEKKKKEEDAKAKAKASDDEDKKTEAANADRIKARRKAEADEDRRVDAIRATTRKYGVTATEHDGKKVENFAAYAIEQGLDARDVELVCLRAARPSNGVGVPGGHVYSTSSPEVNDAVLEAAVFQALGSQFKLWDSDFYRNDGDKDAPVRRVNAAEERRITTDMKARYTDQVQQAAHTIFKGQLGLQQLFTTIAASAGYRGSEVIRDHGAWGTVSRFLGQSMIQADGGSTINVANVLANVQNKALLQGYLYTEQAFLEICFVRPVKDFKATKNVAIFGDFEFKDVGVNGEIEHGTLNDQAFANQALLKARMLTIPLQLIINDDLGAFGAVPMALGRGWGLKVNNMVWTVVLNPGTDEGGTTSFYDTTHTLPSGQVGNSNKSTGAGSVLSDAGLVAATLLFDNQVDPVGNPLGFDAEVLLYPSNLHAAARSMLESDRIVMAALGSTSSASKVGSNNPWYKVYKGVKSRYLNKTAFTGASSTAWYLYANPSIMPAVEIAAWNGSMVPTVQTAGQDFQFNTLGISMRGYGGVGVTKQNFRGVVKSDGA